MPRRSAAGLRQSVSPGGAGVALGALLFGCGAVPARPVDDAAPAGRVQHVVLPGVARLPAFSHATVAGELVFVSGTLGTRPGALELVAGGAGPETAQALRNVAEILAAAGSASSDITRCTVYLADLADFDAMNAAWRAVFPTEPPARTTVGVAALVLHARVELECTAVRSGR
jgi:2-iminobutanoate/2-iminopropanoate deaminase